MPTGNFFYLDTERTWHQIRLPDKELGRGGAGLVYAISDDKVVKKYLTGYLTGKRREELLEKVTIMAFHYKEFASLKGHPFAWPLGPLIETGGDLAQLRRQQKVSFDSNEFCGFVMPRVRNLHNLDDIITLDVLGGRRISGRDRIQIVRRIAEAVQLCHDAQFVIGDINMRNIVVSGDTLLPTIIDCDSFQYRRYAPELGTIDFASAELLKRVAGNNDKFEGLLRRVEDDCHALAVLIFMMLMNGRHPYDCAYGSPHVNARREAIVYQDFPYAAQSPSAPPTEQEGARYARLPTEIKSLFELALLHGKPARAEAWIEPLNRFAGAPDVATIAPVSRRVEPPPPPVAEPVSERTKWIVAALVLAALILGLLLMSGHR